MNLKDLKYLVALADTGHFGKAAERTFVSQPTLSAQLKKLEDYLGVKLVERQPKNVQLTEVGKQVVVRARRMLDEGDEIIALARNNTDPFAGKLKLGLIPTIGPYLLPRVMQKLRKALPHLGLMLYEYQTEPLLKRLRDGEIDLGIMALPVAQDGLESAAVRRGVHGGRCPINIPSAKTTIKVQDLKGQTLLLLEDGHCLRDQALEVCSRIDVARPRIFAPPVWRPCDKWWWRVSASPCCRKPPWSRPSARSAACAYAISPNPRRRAPWAPCGARPARAPRPSPRFATYWRTSWGNAPRPKRDGHPVLRTASCSFCRSFHIVFAANAARCRVSEDLP
jgi:LysR family hydrogen peroxide-inducible transcriptional activator